MNREMIMHDDYGVGEEISREEIAAMLARESMSEEMTREERIDWLCRLRSFLVSIGMPNEWRAKFTQALSDAIAALSAEPCSDAISRQAAENLFRNAREKLKPEDYKSADEFNTRDLMLLNAEQMIHLLPSVHAEPRTGHLVEYDDSAEVQCDQCHRVWSMFSNEVNTFLYCPNCGAKMEADNA